MYLTSCCCWVGGWVGGYRCCKITAKNIVESMDCHDWVLVYFHWKVNALSLPLFHSHTEPHSQHYCEFVSLDQQRTSESVLKRERDWDSCWMKGKPDMERDRHPLQPILLALMGSPPFDTSPPHPPIGTYVSWVLVSPFPVHLSIRLHVSTRCKPWLRERVLYVRHPKRIKRSLNWM